MPSTSDAAAGHRRDIDGLRAIAVGAVIAFHMAPALLPGGFLGVDIFFVISGFLITGIIDRDLAAGHFRLGAFYGRRVRRIAPALLAMLAVVGVAATVILLPTDLIGFGKSVLAALASVSNIYFWRDTDYFARAALTKPLLHTWSLGIEEQYYLFFPLLLIIVARWRRGWLLPLLAALALLSLAADVYGQRFSNGVPAFYLLPTRVWELAAGAILAVWPGRMSARRWAADVTAFAGLGLIVVALAGTGPLPLALPVALPAVVGAVLLLGSGAGAATLVARGLGLAPFVGLGLVSYSLYLWHWPVLVLARYVLVRDLTAAENAVALAAMLALAVLSWAVVERPFRRSTMPIRRVLRLTGGAAALVAAGAAALIVAQGLPGRLSPEVARYNALVGTHFACPRRDSLWFGADRACGLALASGAPGDADLVLLGNSHAQMYAPLVAGLLARDHARGLLVPANGCLPMATLNVSAACAAIAEQNIAAVAALPGVRVVVLGLDWPYPTPLVGRDGAPAPLQGVPGLVAGIDATVSRLQAAGKTVLVIGPIAVPGWDIASDLSRMLAFGRPVDRPLAADAAQFRARFAPLFAWAERRHIVLIRPDRIQCGVQRCPFILDGQLLFTDESHLAGPAVERFAPAFAAPVAASLAARQPPAGGA